ncbi:carboxypeptidase regulatory-like domain-containing protein [Paraflavitalea speifideaquila]|uniref:carboxypeptidase regulatory-like domain-containing protein n=1 Tax=Paraflavitalea speifideaquila TaxID=3076558 RepID=UPI0028F062D6|nr:carboxypeptidase regulatory-like domain-containing protein [Paraflavitalea speifideiaquila]
MNTNRKNGTLSIAILLFLLPFCTHAQVLLTGTLRGKEGPIGWANVVLASPEGKMIAGGLSKEDGRFELRAAKGNYRLTISFLGFVTWEREIKLEQDTTVGAIILQPGAGELSAVTVVSKRN